MQVSVDHIIPDAELDLLKRFKWDGVGVIELGNKKNKRGLYRDWYRHYGAKYLCLDINGEDGAFSVDFRKPLSLAPADFVTNIGFTEHVGPEWHHQRQCWKNVHSLVKEGGWLICVTPKPGEWEEHGMWQPTMDFYRGFAFANGLTLELLDDDWELSKTDKRHVIRAVMHFSKHQEFVWAESWRQLMYRTKVNEYY